MTESLKYQAAVAAVDEVQEGMAVGLGTGSTVTHFINALGARVQSGLKITAIPSSEQSDQLAREVGIPIVGFDEQTVLDVTIDGADEVSPELDLIKGLGGALVREKIGVKASRRVVIVVDETKLVRQLGTKASIPVEIIPMATAFVAKILTSIGGDPGLRTRDGVPFVSDNGNHVIDWYFGPLVEPAALEARLKLMSGVVDSGIFAGVADRVIVAGANGLRDMVRR